DAGDRDLLFGRDADVRGILDRLRSDAVVLVTGDSGVGKSSLCRAGVLPAVTAGELDARRRWRVLSLVPGRQPLAALARSLAPLLGESGDRGGTEPAGHAADEADTLARALAS